MADFPAPYTDDFPKPALGLKPILSGLFWSVILYALAYCCWVAGSTLWDFALTLAGAG
jgi:hypothetical protein